MIGSFSGGWKKVDRRKSIPGKARAFRVPVQQNVHKQMVIVGLRREPGRCTESMHNCGAGFDGFALHWGGRVRQAPVDRADRRTGPVARQLC